MSNQSTSLVLEKLPISGCSICADGSTPSISNSTMTFPISSTVTLSCSDLPTNAIASVYQQGLTHTDYQCSVSQLWAYEYCGCPTPPKVRECWICKDGDTNFQNDVWVPTSAAPEGTCRFQAIMSGITYDVYGRGTDLEELKCPFLTWGMDTWCGCPKETVSLPSCTLCGDYYDNNNNNKYQTAPKPCQRNALAPLLHTAQSTVGKHFGTCQYYDWLVERLNPGQCGVFANDPTIQFNGFDVQGFCCGSPAAAVVSGTDLCRGDTPTLMADQWIPELQATCQTVQEAVPYLRNDTVLLQPLESIGGMSLRDYCCNPPSAMGEDESQSPQLPATCEEIPRIQYERPSGGRERLDCCFLSSCFVFS